MAAQTKKCLRACKLCSTRHSKLRQQYPSTPPFGTPMASLFSPLPGCQIDELLYDIHSSKPNLGTNRIYIWLGSQSQSFAQDHHFRLPTQISQPCCRWGRIRCDLGFVVKSAPVFPFGHLSRTIFFIVPLFLIERESLFSAAIFPVILSRLALKGKPVLVPSPRSFTQFRPFPSSRRLDVFGLV